MATSSFFYGGSTAPEQNTVDELIDALNQKVSAADQDRVAAEQARDRAETAASNAELSESNVAGLAQQAQETLADANEAVAAANAAVAGTAANAATATTKAAEASASADAALASQTAAASSASAASASQTASASSATAAAASQSAAATSASNSASSASAAATSATNSASSATASQASRVASEAARDAAVVAQNAAQSSQTAAASSATAAAGSATTASNAATAAQAAQTAAEAAFDSFDDRYLGAKAVAPTVDNDGNALLTGALYFNNTANQMYAWSGSAWVAAGSTGSGDVAGPASSTDNAIARFDGTTGKLVQNSTATVSDTGDAVFKSVNFNDPVHGSRTLSMSSGRLVVDGDFDTVGTYRFGNGWCYLSGGNADGVTLAQLSSGTGNFVLQPNSTGIVETRSGTNPITFRIYNTYTDASNYERGFVRWNTNVLEIGAEKAGTGTLRPIRLASDFINLGTGTNSVSRLDMSGVQEAVMRDSANGNGFMWGWTYYAGGYTVAMNSAGQFAWANNTTGFISNNLDTGLARDSAGVVRVTNGSTGRGDLRVNAVDANGGLTLNAGTANQVQFLNGSKVLTGSANLTFNGTTLTVADLTDSSLTANRVVFAGTGGNLQTSNNYQTDSVGNLGLGVTPTSGARSASLQVGGGGVFRSENYNGSTNHQIKMIGNGYEASDTSYRYLTTANATLYNQISGAHTWHTAPSGTAGNAISFTQAMTLDASGNWGLGTSSISSFTGYTVAQINGSTSGLVEILSNGTRVGGLFNDPTGSSGNGDFLIRNLQNGALRFLTNNTERARIDSSGNLLVGTTSAQSIGGRLTVVRSSDNAGTFITDTNNFPLVAWQRGGTSNLIYFGYGAGGGQVGAITTNGTTTSYGTSSDYRLKEDVQPMTGALAKVAALKPCTYKWKADGSEGEGFIAHELAEVCPSAVFGEKDAVDEDGKIKPQNIDTSFLVATLTAAIQEQQAIIDAQAAALEQLKARLDVLESK